VAAEDTVDVTVSLTARVSAPEGGGGYDITSENGNVTIKKFGSNNKTPVIALTDLERAVRAVKGAGT
jgi:hypothetical protein